MLGNDQNRLIKSRAGVSLLSAFACVFLIAACSSTQTPKPSKVHVKASKVTGSDGKIYSLSRVLITPENTVRITVVDDSTTKTEVGAVSRARYEAVTGDLFVKSCKEIKLTPTTAEVPESNLARFQITQNVPTWVFVKRCV